MNEVNYAWLFMLQVPQTKSFVTINKCEKASALNVIHNLNFLP